MFRDFIIVSFSSVVRHMLDLSTRQRVVVTASCWEVILSIIRYVVFHQVATSWINFNWGRESWSCTLLSLSDALLLRWKNEIMSLHLLWSADSVVSAFMASWTTRFNVWAKQDRFLHPASFIPANMLEALSVKQQLILDISQLSTTLEQYVPLCDQYWS